MENRFRGFGPFALLLLVLLTVCAACSQSAGAKKARFMESGRRLYDQGDYSRAVIEWKNAEALANGDPEPDYWLGMGYLAVGNLPLAISSFHKAALINPKHAAAQLRLAELLTLSNDPDVLNDAVKRLQTVLNTASSVNALNTMALTEFKLGKADDSQKYLDEALEKFPQELSSYVILAKIKIAKQDFDGAEEVLKKAIAASPKSVDAHIALGAFYVSTQRDKEAEDLFRQAVDLDKKSGSALYELAVLEYRTGRKGEAEQIFRQLSTFQDPSLKPLHAIYLLKEGDQTGAIAEFEKLVKDNPKVPDLRSKLIAAYWVTKQMDQVERTLNAVLKKNPKDLEAVLQRGELYVATGKYAQAEADLNMVLGLRPDSAQVHYVFAKLSQARGADLAYRQGLAETLRLEPGLLQARLELAERLRGISPESALKTLNETPAGQKSALAVLIARNWALKDLKDFDELRYNVKVGLAAARTPELLMQDGFVKIADRDFAGARASIEEGISAAPADPHGVEALVALYNAQNQSAELAKRLQQIAQNSRSPEIKYYVGGWLLQNGKRDQARELFLAAKSADPGFHEADFALALMDVSDGKLDQARTAMNALILYKDQDSGLRIEEAAIEAATNHIPEAIEQYRKVLAIDQTNLFALNNLAYLLANTNQSDQALAYAQKAKELGAGQPEVEDTLGWVLYRRAIYGEAVNHLEAAVKKSSDPAIQYHLGLAYVKTGKRDQGEKVLRNALKLAPNLMEAQLARQAIGITQ
jgi:tetratricopeptide (TPR) repeat protein